MDKNQGNSDPQNPLAPGKPPAPAAPQNFQQGQAPAQPPSQPVPPAPPVTPPTQQMPPAQTPVPPAQPQAPQAPSAPPAMPPTQQMPPAQPPVPPAQPPAPPAPPAMPPAQQFPPTQPQTPGQPPMPPPAQPGGGQYQGEPAKKTNTLAIISLISAFFVSILAIILGHIALGQIKKTGEGGRGLALTGTILGYVFTFAGAVILIITLAAGAFLSSVSDDFLSELDDELNSSDIFDDEVQDDDFFSEDDFDDFDDDWDDYEMPWAGTPHEAFCDSLMDFELIYDDTSKYFSQIAKNAPSDESKKIYEDAAKIFVDDKAIGDNLDLFDKAQDQVDKDLDLCFDF